jgi:hypothetical protein
VKRYDRPTRLKDATDDKAAPDAYSCSHADSDYILTWMLLQFGIGAFSEEQ